MPAQNSLASNAAISAAGALAAVSVGPPSDYTLSIEVLNLTGARIRVGIEDSPDGTNWSPLAVWVFSGPGTDNSRTLRAYDVPGLQAQARVHVYEILGSAHLNAGIY